MAENHFLLFGCILFNFGFEDMESFWLYFCYGDFLMFVGDLVLGVQKVRFLAWICVLFQSGFGCGFQVD